MNLSLWDFLNFRHVNYSSSRMLDGYMYTHGCQVSEYMHFLKWLG